MRKRRRCEAIIRSGRECRAWAVRESDPPRCVAHQADRSAHVCSPGSGPVLAGACACGEEAVLADEIAGARETVRRLLEEVNSEPAPTPGELARLAPLIFRGTRTVALLLRDQRALTGKAADGIAGAVAQALDEFSSEWNIEL